jgi:hypothetical protein
MSQDQPTPSDEDSRAACRRCGQLKGDLLGELCLDCINETLLARLPLLRRTLEDKYGPALDEWLAGGRILGAQWVADPDLLIGRERLEDFVREVIKEVADKEGLGLSLPGDDELWRHSRTDELVDWVRAWCREELHRVNESLAEAISRAPTPEAERELIEIVSGGRRVESQEIRDDAISAVMITEGTPLPFPAKALIELRYRSDGGRASYVRVADDEISSVWREIEADLPPDLGRLITTDEW